MILRYSLLILIMISISVDRLKTNQFYSVQTCTESVFDAALATAKDGDTITLSCDTPIMLTTPKAITHNITITGRQQHITSTYQGSKPLITVAMRQTVTINNLIFDSAQPVGIWLQNEGNLKISRCIFRYAGAAIHNAQGTLTAQDSLFEKNTHGIRNYGGNISISRVMFRNNEATALYNSRSAMILDSIFIGNGHGVDNGGGVVIIRGSKFYNNEVRHLSTVGAGIASSGKAYILDSTFVNNIAERGSGVFNRSGGYLLLIRTVVANNIKGNCRGSIWDGGGNAQYPARSCGKSVRVDEALKNIQLTWASQ